MTTPLAQVRKASKLTMRQFAKLLGMEYRTAQSYCLGSRELPSLSNFAALEYSYGVDLKTLKETQARSITGHLITTEFCAGWKDHSNLSPDEVRIALKQLNTMMEATLTCLSKKAPHKARIFLHKVSSIVNGAIHDAHLLRELNEYFDADSFGETIELPEFNTGKDLREKYPDNLIDKNRWAKWVLRFHLNKALKLIVNTRPTFGTPDYLKMPSDLHGEAKRNWRNFGFGAFSATLRTFTVIQEGIKSPSSFQEVVSESVVSGVYFPSESSQVRESAPKKKLSNGRKSLPLNPSKAKKAAPALKRKR